ncbi:MAG: glycosyltransferase, partial [Thermoguttaceae bacterium]|nr:glycosyltransferase [Thermoguttaceae bacterium]MBQ9126692.1 glycosyltransferase [Thermoguttaceae bacterium]
MRKVAVIGHFGFGREYLDGQTVKTKIVAQELERRFGETQVLKSDTHGGAKTLLKAPFHVFRALKRCENVVILPAHNGLRVIAPLLAFERRFFKNRKIHYAVIGGWLPEFLTKRPRLAKALKTFDGIYVETNVMKRALEAQGFANVWVMPNCKYLDALDESELVYPTSEPYKLCTFSRVMREKGIEDAVDAVKKVNERFGRTVYTLDIYGQVDPAQTEWFDALRKTFPDFVAYRGSVPFDK